MFLSFSVWGSRISVVEWQIACLDLCFLNHLQLTLLSAFLLSSVKWAKYHHKRSLQIKWNIGFSLKILCFNHFDDKYLECGANANQIHIFALKKTKEWWIGKRNLNNHEAKRVGKTTCGQASHYESLLVI